MDNYSPQSSSKYSDSPLLNTLPRRTTFKSRITQVNQLNSIDSTDSLTSDYNITHTQTLNSQGSIGLINTNMFATQLRGRKDNSNLDCYDPMSIDFMNAGTGRRIAYRDFTTIDWIHDTTKERVRQRHLLKTKGWRGVMDRTWDTAQSWIVVISIGLITGLVAGYINIASEWLGNVKDGVCSFDFYLNRHFCCWFHDKHLMIPGDECIQWRTWASLLLVSNESLNGVQDIQVSQQEGWSAWFINYLFYTFWATLMGVSSAILVKYYAPYAAGSGIPEVKTILGGFVMRKFLGIWTLGIKILGLILSVASGLCLGKEGPLVHVSCAIGNIISRFFDKFAKNEAKKREILSAASAAGVSVAFGAPIGGVLFSLEEVSYYFPYKTMWRSFFAAMIAAISLRLVNPFRTGKLVLFQVESMRHWHGFELPFFILLGILGGVYGSFFIQLNLKYAQLRRKTWIHPILLVALVSLLTALVSFPFSPLLRVNMSELCANLFKECNEMATHFTYICRDETLPIILELLFTTLVKIGLTIITFGIQVPCGIFIPSMAIGATVGRVVGILVQSLVREYSDFWMFSSCSLDKNCVTPGTYAIIGAAASLAGVTRMTVSLTVIMFELTGALNYILPIMMTVMVANWVGNALGSDSIYDGLVKLNGYPYLDIKEDYIHNTTASGVMTDVSDLDVISSQQYTISTLDDMLKHTDYQGFPVVSNVQDLNVIGYAGKAELQYALSRAKLRLGIHEDTPCHFSTDRIFHMDSFLDLKPWMDSTPLTLHPKFPMEMVLELYKKMGLRYVLITRNGKLEGLITKKDLLRHLKTVSSPLSFPLGIQTSIHDPLHRLTG